MVLKREYSVPGLFSVVWGSWGFRVGVGAGRNKVARNVFLSALEETLPNPTSWSVHGLGHD